jgi:hypothetical protein
MKLLKNEELVLITQDDGIMKRKMHKRTLKYTG